MSTDTAKKEPIKKKEKKLSLRKLLFSRAKVVKTGKLSGKKWSKQPKGSSFMIDPLTGNKVKKKGTAQKIKNRRLMRKESQRKNRK